MNKVHDQLWQSSLPLSFCKQEADHALLVPDAKVPTYLHQWPEHTMSSAASGRRNPCIGIVRTGVVEQRGAALPQAQRGHRARPPAPVLRPQQQQALAQQRRPHVARPQPQPLLWRPRARAPVRRLTRPETSLQILWLWGSSPLTFPIYQTSAFAQMLRILTGIKGLLVNMSAGGLVLFRL